MIALSYERQADLVLDQVDGRRVEGDLPNSVVIVWGGANDIIAAMVKRVPTPAEGKALGERIGETQKRVIDMFKKRGVTQFLVAELPDLSHASISTGAGQEWTVSPDKTAFAREVALSLNAYINNPAFNDEPGRVTVRIIPVQKFLDDAIAGQYTSPIAPMTETTNPCIPLMTGDKIRSLLLPSHANRKECDGYLFFDRLHPTSQAHCLLAGLFADALREGYDGVQGPTGAERVTACALKQKNREIFDDGKFRETWDDGISWR